MALPPIAPDGLLPEPIGLDGALLELPVVGVALPPIAPDGLLSEPIGLDGALLELLVAGAALPPIAPDGLAVGPALEVAGRGTIARLPEGAEVLLSLVMIGVVAVE